jgi:hypothetical protein
MADEFYLSDAQWERRAVLLPNKPRGVPRVDDRRIISGIVHVLTLSGCSDASDDRAGGLPPTANESRAGQSRWLSLNDERQAIPRAVA